MKTQPKKYGNIICGYRKHIIVTISITIMFLLFLTCCMFLRRIAADRNIANALANTPEPEICALCGNGNGVSYHAPVVVNLSTGESGELRVYDLDPCQRNELAKEQSTGTFSFLNIAGIMGYRDTCDHSSHVTLPKEREWGLIDPSHFCHNCRTLLADTATTGYAVVDLYDLDNIMVYAIEKGAEYTIRDYAVSISTQNELKCLSINVTGLLFCENE